MMEHYLDLAVREAQVQRPSSSAQAAAVRDVRRDLERAEPSFREVQDDCTMASRAEVSCAIDSTTTKAWEGCLRDGGE